MKVITLGGGFIADHLPYENINWKIRPNEDDVYYVINSLGNNPSIVINCIGKTGRPNVDWCESHKAETYEANVVIPLMIAKFCEKRGIRMIHIGSGCIYFGESPHKNDWLTERHDNTIKPEDPNYFYGAFELADAGWKETDFANPQSYYSKTKYACDLALGQMPHVITLRIRMPISDRDVPRNLINKLKGYSQLIDIPNSMTFMDDFTRCVQWSVKNELPGIYHVVNPGALTAVEIMQEYQKYVPNHTFSTITEEQLGTLTTAKRSNCILNADKLQQAGFTMTPAKEALQLCMKNYFVRKHV